MRYDLVIFDWDGTLMEAKDCLYSDAEPMLSTLQLAGVKLAVATGKDYVSLSWVLSTKKYSHYFQAIRTADQTRMKPDPLMLEEILSELNVPIQKALMVGDSVYDIEMAQKINMDCVGITTGGSSSDLLRVYNPTYIINELSELLAITLKN